MTDDTWGPTSFLPFIGNQDYHFNGLNPWRGDTREILADLHLNAAIDLWNGYVSFNPELLPICMMDRAMGYAGVDFSALYLNILAEYLGGSRDWSSNRWPSDAHITSAAFYELANCDKYGERVRRELALLHLGMGLHALQDIHAHGEIGSGPSIFGHLRHSLPWNRRLGDPDSYDYVWRFCVPEFHTFRLSLTRLTGEDLWDNNTRIQDAIDYSMNFLLDFMSGVGMDVSHIRIAPIATPVYGELVNCAM